MSNTETRSDMIERRIDKTVSARTEIAASGTMSFQNVEQLMEFAKVMALAGVAIPKHLRENPGACLAVCMQASEWRMSPFSVANKSYSVNDRLAYEAQLINAVILQRAPIIGRLKITYTGEGDTRRCKVAARLRDEVGETVEYESPAFVKIPVKNSPLWKSDPDQQLFYYSSRAMCRRHFPDVLLGVYTDDEMHDAPPVREASGRVIPSAPRVPSLEPVEEAAPSYTVATFWSKCDSYHLHEADVYSWLVTCNYLKQGEDLTAEIADRVPFGNMLADLAGGDQ